MNPLSLEAKSKEYTKFKQGVLDNPCMACGLCQTRNHIVFDRGNPAAEIMLIGEAPGEKEDLSGTSFVGRSGKMLDWAMNEIGLDTNKDILIASVLKCRPPNNRKPTAEEAEKCLPFLKKQIEIVRPKVLVLLGNTAIRYLFPEEKDKPMSELIGRVFTYKQGDLSIPALVLYHPAYLLYSPKKKPEMVEVARRIHEIIQSSNDSFFVTK